MEGDTLAALNWFNQGFSCAQAIVATFGNQYGLDVEHALRVAGAFGGGMARMGETCGAVTGALMAIGLAQGSDTPSGKESTYALGQAFLESFEARHDTILCRELIQRDISTPEGFQQAREQAVFKALCPRFIRDSVEIIKAFLVKSP